MKKLVSLVLSLFTISSFAGHESLCTKLYNAGVIKEGSFKLKSGITSPIYIDMRLIISYPEIFNEIVDAFCSQLKSIDFDSIVGVPYAALPFASGAALKSCKSMIMLRKEIKDHGTTKLIEGSFKAGENVVVIEDIVTSGSSILETAAQLKKEGLNVRDAIVFLDREQGAKEKLAEHGIRLHAICTLSDVLNTLEKSGSINKNSIESIRMFIAKHRF